MKGFLMYMKAFLMFLGVTAICVALKLIFPALEYTAMLAGSALFIAIQAYIKEQS